VALACVLIGFIGAVVIRSRPPGPEGRVPQRFRLAALIQRQQQQANDLRTQAEALRHEVDSLRVSGEGRQSGAAAREHDLSQVSLLAGLVALHGPGLRVVLDDSNLSKAPSGNVNDLVIHSQDVQAVVNALWRAGADAVAINDERLITTSAVLCVGNTLLLNGTVHSPPYRVVAIGADHDQFEADGLVHRLHGDAAAFGLRFSVERADGLDVPAFTGATSVNAALPIGS
jgi:uncharacterized protein YlxW (UPF0749 family)